MPSINLRLTEAEHMTLKAWAQESQRSIQREAVWRIFSELTEREQAGQTGIQGSGSASARLPAVLASDARSRKVKSSKPSPRSASSDDPHFKPDFGGKLR